MKSIKVPVMTLIGVMAVSAAPARADEGYKPDQAFATCVNKVSDGDNNGLYECGKALLTREETRLQTTWNSVSKALDDPQIKARLLADQRRWVSFKDQTCGFWAQDSGSMGHAQYPLCVAEIVAARRDYLKEIGDWP